MTSNFVNSGASTFRLEQIPPRINPDPLKYGDPATSFKVRASGLIAGRCTGPDTPTVAACGPARSRQYSSGFRDVRRSPGRCH